MECVCTIADIRYSKYLYRFVYSVRAAGWRGPIVVITKDKGLYANCEIRHAKASYKTREFMDSRWLKLELDSFFQKGDQVLFFDTDIVLFEGFPFVEMMRHELSMTTVPMHHDVTVEMPLVKRILGVEPDQKYLASPLGFRVNSRTHKFFDLWRDMRETSSEHRKGTMFALNMAVYAWKQMYGKDLDPWLLPHERCAYTLTIKFKEYNKITDPVLMHYGGGLGKKVWDEEYRKGIKFEYR